MFDQDNYESDQQSGTPYQSNKKGEIKITSNKVLAPSTGSDFNQLTGQGENLLKLMKERGLDVSDKQVNKLKPIQNKNKQTVKANKPKSGFFDGGNSATIEQLQKALKKSIAMADPSQACCILSYLLQKKNLTKEDRNKYGSMRCNILYRMGAFEECISKAQELVKICEDSFSLAVLHNIIAKCQRQTGNRILKGYMHLTRAKAEILNAKQDQQTKQAKQKALLKALKNQSQDFAQQDFLDSQVDVVYREINQTELEYNMKIVKYKSKLNMITPHFQIFKNRKIIQVSCGDYHSLFLVGNPLLTSIQAMDSEIREQPNQVFGIGQNNEGQIRGRACSQIYKQPIIVTGLCGKNVQGIFAFKQTSLAFDNKGNIYEWGAKQNKNFKIDTIQTKIKEQFIKIQKGVKHYALLTKSNKLYTWGNIMVSNANLIKQAQPKVLESIFHSKIIDFSCGYNHVIAIDQQGNGFALGNNQEGQLCLGGQKHTKAFKKVAGQQLKAMGKLRKVQCIEDCSFFINQQDQVYFCGKHSQTKQSQHKIRQAQFHTQQEQCPLQIGGTIGSYHVTMNVGKTYRWKVDQSVKFKIDPIQKDKICRAVYNMRGQQFYLTQQIQPKMCMAWRQTQNPESYAPIKYQIFLKDSLGPYNIQFITPVRCQIFLSTYQIDKKQLMKNNQQFLLNTIEMEQYGMSSSNQMLKVSQIVQMRLINFKIQRNKQKMAYCNLEITNDRSGKFYFYIILNDQKIFQEQLKIEVSAKQKQLQEKLKQQRKLRDQQRKRNAELDRQKILEDRLKKQQQEQQRRKQTQRRAQQALKNHMRQKQQLRQRLQIQRKRRAELQTGGGFDLSKLKKKEE